MFTNYLKLLFRNMWKNKFFTILNITGLAVGMACYLLIFKYTAFEISYDDFHQHKNRIYRIQRNIYENNELKSSDAKTSFNIGAAFRDTFPGIDASVRLADFPSNTVSYGDHSFVDEKIFITEPSVFDVFSFRLLKGDPKTALAGPNSAVISETLAAKYFGSEDPMGKNLRILTKGREYSCIVNGIIRDVPENSHLQFDCLVSLSTIWGASFSDWIYSTFYNFLLLTPDTDPRALETQFPAFVKEHILPHVPRAANWKILLQPLSDIHLYSDLRYDTKNGDGKTVYFLLVIAFLILVISWINYVNLSTARAMERAREVGMRKVMGAGRIQLIRQFLGESLLVNILPLVIAVILFFLFIPYLRELAGKTIPLSTGDAWFLLNLAGLYIAGSLLSGLYPAFVLSAFKPVTVLKRSKLSQTTGGALLRKILVTFQFAASVILIIVTLTVYRQIEYMRSGDLGIDIDRMMAVQLPSTPVNKAYLEKVNALSTELKKYPSVRYITGSSTVPGSVPSLQRLCWREGIDFKDGKSLSIITVDYDFIPAYGMELVKGRNFSKEFGTDTSRAVIINEAAARLLDLGDNDAAVKKRIFIWMIGNGFNVVGIVKNYHHQSLKKEYDPIIFLLRPDIKSFYSLKLKPGNIDETIAAVRAKWEEVFPGYSFDYFFLDDYFDRQYRADRQFGNVLGIFVLLTILITCLGLLGLSYFTTYQRTKEIGIRKTFGASLREILILLMKGTVKLIVIAAVIAWPAAYLIVDGWLKNYAVRIGVPLEIFILSGLLVALVALLTLAYHSVMAARAAPVDSLREE